MRDDSVVRALTDMRFKWNCGTKITSLRISWELNLTSPIKRIGTEVLFGKVTVECQKVSKKKRLLGLSKCVKKLLNP